MATQVQGQQSSQPQGRKRFPLGRLIIATIIFLLVDVGITIEALNIQGPLATLPTVLSIVFAVLGSFTVFFQFLLPSGTVEPPPSLQSLPLDKVTFRGILSLPPLTDPQTIQQREKAVKEVYTKLIQPDVTAIALTGIGGVGKSTLAALIYRYAEEQRRIGKGPFTAEAIWLKTDASVTMFDLACMLFKAIKKPLSDFGRLSPINQATTLFNVLDTADNARIVILDQFENLLDWETGHALIDRPGIDEWLDIINSKKCRCRVLFTSRPWPQGSREYPPIFMQEYPVKGLELAEGMELLQKLGVKATEKELRIAVERSAGHAFALVLLTSLLRNHSLSLADLFGDQIYARLWTGDIAHNLLDYIYTKQLSEVQRKLLLAFSIYREPIPLEAAQAVIDPATDTPKPQIQFALKVLLTQHLLQASGEERYQLHVIVADYARRHFVENDEQANQQALQEAHARAAQYYLQQAAIHCPPRKQRRGIKDVQPLIEVIWQKCQAQQWLEAYNLMEQEDIFNDLKRWGGNAVLLELYERLLPLEKWHPEPAQAVYIFTNLGRVYRTLGKRELARDYLEKALDISKELGDRKGEGTLRSFLGSVYADLGQKNEAQEHLEMALKIQREIGDRGGEGWTLDNLGRVYDDLGREEQAREHLEQALKIRRDVEDRRGEERTLSTLGRILNNLGQKEGAQKYYEHALSICVEIGDRLGEGLTLSGLGLLYVDLGQKERAREYLDQALTIRQEVRDRGGEGRTLHYLGRLYRLQRQNDQAQEYLEQALSINREIRDRLGESKTLNDLAMIHHDRGHDEQALSYLKQALDICVKVGNRTTGGWTLHNLGRVYADLGLKEQAQKYFERALHVRREVGDRRGEGWTLHNIGMRRLEQEHYELALSCFFLAKDIFEEVQSPDRDLPQRYIERLHKQVGEEQFATLSTQVEPQPYLIVEQALRDDL